MIASMGVAPAADTSKELAQQGDANWAKQWAKFLGDYTSLVEVPKLLRSMCGVSDEVAPRDDEGKAAKNVDLKETLERLKAQENEGAEDEAGRKHRAGGFRMQLFKRTTIKMMEESTGWKRNITHDS